MRLFLRLLLDSDYRSMSRLEALRRLLALTAPLLLLLAAPAHAQAPFPGAVPLNGGWVPCSHPLAIEANLGCAPLSVISAPDPRPFEYPTFIIGRSYYHSPTGSIWTIIAAANSAALPAYTGPVFILEGSCGELRTFPVIRPPYGFQLLPNDSNVVTVQTCASVAAWP